MTDLLPNKNLTDSEFEDHIRETIAACEKRQVRWYPSREEIDCCIRQMLPLDWAHIADYDFSNVEFYGMSFEHAYIVDCNFRGASLPGSYFRHAQLRRVDFHAADLTRSSFGFADTACVDFTNADLRNSVLYNADLYGATGLKVVAPIGNLGRAVYAYTHEGEVRIQAGCRNGTPAEIRAAVKEDYDPESWGYADYMEAIAFLTKWGKRELARIKAQG